uniref:Uncharacterized protein n=1 Tax=Meloidogyne enterolobii TaxID=390850 RepID=A0A6V7VHQ6_MELEN|nr:unnamed protein product [Meloidogyne enterolobii]
MELDKENKIVTTKMRYTTLHEDFPIQGKKTRSTMERSKVFTRSLNLHQIINIAYKKVSRGRTIQEDNYLCHNFVYELIIAIAQNKERLFEYESWPEGIRSLDNSLKGEGETAFQQVVNDIITNNKYSEIDDYSYTSQIGFNNLYVKEIK